MASYVSAVTIPLALANNKDESMPAEYARWMFAQLVAVRAMRLASLKYEPPLDARANLFTVPPSQIATVLDTDRQPVGVRNLIPVIKDLATRVALSYKYMSLETMIATTDEDTGMHFYYTVNSGMLEPKVDLTGEIKTLKIASMLLPINAKADFKQIYHDMHFTPKSNNPITDAGIGLIQFLATNTGDRKQVLDYQWNAILFLSTRRRHKRTSFASGKTRARRATRITVDEEEAHG